MARKIFPIFLLLFTLNSCRDSDEDEMLKYLNVLKKYDFKNVSIRKVAIDPSYKFPYSVYIKLTINPTYHKNVIKDLRLISKGEVDTTIMQRKMNVDEYQLYFMMSSINKSRNTFLKETEKNIEWWPQHFEGPVFSGSYLDDGKQRLPVSFDQKRNGRIVASINGSTIYFLIECWG